MAKLVFGMNQSLDGYVDHMEFAPGPGLFRHFIQQVRGLTGSANGRRMYEVMRVWDEDFPEWGAEERDFAAAWRSKPKWVPHGFQLLSLAPLTAANRTIWAASDGILTVFVQGTPIAETSLQANYYSVRPSQSW
jgi:hypothetical protein